MIEIIAHRGYTENGTRENTFNAFNQAFDRNLDGIEFDVQRTTDGFWIVHHDKNILKHPIKALTLHRLQNICRNNGFEIPLLENVIEIFHKNKLNIECKVRSSKLGSELAKLVENKGNLELHNISSFHIDSLRGINQENKSIKISYLLKPFVPSKWSKYNSELNFFSINPFYIFLTKRLVQNIQSKECLVIPWTVNNPNAITRMIKIDVDKIMTDQPTLIQRIRSSITI